MAVKRRASTARTQEKDSSEKTKPTRSARSGASRASASRMKVVWIVCDANAHGVKTFDYGDRGKADMLATKLTKDKGNTHFVRQVKQPMAEIL